MTIRDIMQEGMTQIKADEDKDSSGNEEATVTAPSSTDVEKESEQKVETENTETTTKPEKKRNDMQGRINAKHAEMMQYKEKLEKEKAEKDTLLSRIEALEKPKPETEDLTLDTMEDLEGYLKKVPTKEELVSIVKDLIGSELNKAKETVEQETMANSYKKKQTDFLTHMVKFYNPDNDADFILDEEAKEEASLIMDLFEGKPDYYLKVAKDRGIAYLKKFINGDFEAEQKADKVKTIIEKADAIRTNIDSNNNVSEHGTDAKMNSFGDILKQSLKKIKNK